MKPALLLACLPLLACTEPPPAAPASAQPPVVSPAVVNPMLKPKPMTPGALHMKLLGKHLDDAGLKVAGAPKIDAPAWAKPRAEPGVVILEDERAGFRMELRASAPPSWTVDLEVTAGDTKLRCGGAPADEASRELLQRACGTFR